MISYAVDPRWYDGVYKDAVAPCAAARPFCMTHGGRASSAVLLVHGYAGYPGEMVSPARELYEAGFDVYVPRLPGMGTSGADFASSTADDWLRLVQNASLDLYGEYGSLSVVSHSMGCLLSIIASADVPYSKAVLASPAIKLRNGASEDYLRDLKEKGGVLDLPWKSDPRYVLLYENAPCDDGYLGAQYWSHLYPGPMLGLYGLQKKAAGALCSYNVPTLVLYGTEDELVLLQQTLFSSSCVRFSYINGGSHYLYYDKNREAYAKAVAESVGFLSEG